MRKRLLILDAETGGLDCAEHSVLSLGAVIWNNGNIDAKFQVVIREPQMSTTLEALRVNGLTHEIIENEGVSPLTAVQALQNFLLANDLHPRITLAGHNVAFDVGFLRRLYRLAGFPDKAYGKIFSYRVLCTQTLALALEAAGRCDFKSTSLDALCKHFKIKIRDEDTYGRHDALEDATAAARLLTAELALIRDPPREPPSQSTTSEGTDGT
jgi:DNA polymerase III epsilon subunit-like protein